MDAPYSHPHLKGEGYLYSNTFNNELLGVIFEYPEYALDEIVKGFDLRNPSSHINSLLCKQPTKGNQDGVYDMPTSSRILSDYSPTPQCSH